MYQVGKMTLTRDGDRFTLTGDVMPSGLGSDHYQLIYEALEMAAASDDKFAQDFSLMRDEIVSLSSDWDEHQ